VTGDLNYPAGDRGYCRAFLWVLAVLGLACSGSPSGPAPPPPPPPPPAPAPVASVSVLLALPDLSLGWTTQGSATLRSATSQILTGRTVSWSSSAPTVAAATITGEVTALAAGTADIIATAEGVSGAQQVRVHPTDPNFALENLYLTQSVQRWEGGVPLVVGGNPVLLNLFGTLDRPYAPGFPIPRVRVELFVGADLVLTDEHPMTGAVGASVDAGAPLHQVVLPASIVQPGLGVRATLLGGGALPEASQTDNTWPRTGTPWPIAVQQVPPLPLHFLPIQLTVGGSVGTVTQTNLPAYLTATRQMHPISTIDADIGPVFSSDVDFGGGTESAWVAILQQVDIVRVLEGATSYYVGALRPPPDIGFVQFGGYAYIPGDPTGTGPNTRTTVLVGLGWFSRARQTTELVAHELGHTMGRRHAACGGAAFPDPFYPYGHGSIGSYGHDLFNWSPAGSAMPFQYGPETGDIMSYCQPAWISDYTYRGLLAARGGAVAGPPLLAARPPGPSTCPCLVVWGSVSGGSIRLEPSFVAPPPARPTIPAPGPYSLRGMNRLGNPEFELTFDPVEIDHAPGVRHFTIAIPLSEAQGAALARIEVQGQGREAAQSLGADLQGASAAPTVERSGPNALTIRWNRSEVPLLIVRDPETGRVFAISRSGAITVPTSRSELEVIVPGAMAGTALRVRP
jgi:Big-like domain-containing protein